MRKTDYAIIFLICLYIILLPLAPSSSYEWGLCLLFLAVGLIYLLEIIFCIGVSESFKENFKTIMLNKFNILFIALVLIMTVSSMYSKDKIVSIKVSLRFLYYLYIYLIIRFRINKVDFYELLIKVYMFSTLVLSTYGLYDFISHYDKKNTLDFILDNRRLTATLGHYNSYGAYLVLAVFPAMMLAFKLRGKSKIYFSILSLILCTNLALTFSRNAWLALAVGILLLTVLYDWKFIILCIVPTVFVTLVPNILQRIRLIRYSGVNQGRIRLWKIAEKIIDENLFLGIGSGNFANTYKGYVERFPEYKGFNVETIPPHNSYIKVFAELGIFGAMTFLLLCIEMVRKVYYVSQHSHGLVQKFYSGYFISVICFLIMNCFDDLFFTPKVTALFIIFISLAFSCDSKIGYIK